MIERLVPDTVATAETWSDLLNTPLFADEERSLGRAVEKRRREFVSGRACARIALRRLGAPIAPVASGERGEPLWPAGIVGSITHCHKYRACAVARADQVASMGIDAEPNEPLPKGVFECVAFGHEREIAATRNGALGDFHGVCMDRLLFSAKEAVYKLWFPLAKRWLGFEDAEISIHRHSARFHARLLVPGPVVERVRLSELRGSWCIEGETICTAVVLPRPRAPSTVGVRAEQHGLAGPQTDLPPAADRRTAVDMRIPPNMRTNIDSAIVAA